MKRNIILFALSAALASLAHAANPALPVIPSTVFNITNHGAVGDGITDNTTAIQNAINAANAAGGGIVEIPAGTFDSGPITLLSSINLHLDTTNAILQMLPYGTYPGGTTGAKTFIGCNGIHDLEISGQGTIDGQGAAWWAAAATNGSLVRPMLLNLYTVNRLFIHDVTYMNPAGHTCGYRDNGGNILVSNLTVNTVSPSPNTDGENFVGTNCIFENCHIADGDDDIAMGATGPINDLLITNCTIGTGHGISFGSGITGVSNVTVVNCTFNQTQNALRIKCSHANSLYLQHVNYFNIGMTNAEYCIVFYSYYDYYSGPDNITPAIVLNPTNSFPITANTPRWGNITISNLTATLGSGSQAKIGGVIWGPAEWPITNVTLVNVNLTAPHTFDLYNVYGVKIIDSQFNFSSGNTFTLCNAGVTISNSVPGAKAVSIGGGDSANNLALYNANATMVSPDLFECNPLTLSGSVLSNTGNLAFTNNQVINFALGTNAATLANTGNLNLTGTTLNFTAAGGFTATTYTLFTYSGALSGTPTMGAMPAGYSGVLNTSTTGQVKLVLSYTGTSPTTTALLSSANPATVGTAVTFTAAVNPAPTNGETITFLDGTTTLGSGTLSGGQAAYTTSANQLAVGSHTITAVYGGDGAYLASTSSIVSQQVNAATPPGGLYFSDTFGSSTIDSASPTAPTATSASYEVLSGKSWNPTPTIAAGHLKFGIGATSSGVVEVQVQFAASPIALTNTGNFIQLTVTFTDTAGILNQSGYCSFGLYNSGGSMPVAGGLNATLGTAYNTSATGGAQNWQGYVARFATNANPGFYDRKTQTGTANNNQDLVSSGSSSSYANPGAAGISTVSNPSSVTLANGSQYTEVLIYTLTATQTLQLASQLYTGSNTNGTLLATMTATTGTPLTTAFDSLAMGWQAAGGTASTMDVNAITVTGPAAVSPPPPPPTIQAAFSGSTLTLAWPASYLGWLVQSNAVGLATTNWATDPASGGTTNYSITINPAMTNVYFRLIEP